MLAHVETTKELFHNLIFVACNTTLSMCYRRKLTLGRLAIDAKTA